MARLIPFILFIVLPLAEIAVFILVGGVIGALPTILLIILSAILGSVLLKRQGAAAMQALKADMDAGEVQASAVGETITIALAGLLLLTPGFITDAIGLALFIPPVRHWMWGHLSGAIEVRNMSPGRAGRRGGTINLDENEYEAHSQDNDPRQSGPPRNLPGGQADPSSPWNAQN